MRPYPIALILAALLPSLAAAQVKVNPAALAQLAGIPPARPAAAPAPPAKPAWHPARRVIRVVKPAPLKPLPPSAAPAMAKPVPAPAPVATPQALVVAFAPGSATLPAGTTAALKPFCEARGVISIDARAPADPSDPSLAMRLSLARALALRDALTSCGVASQNILPRALGSMPGKNDDEAVLGVQK
ncbi:hypothetical protein [Acidocella sp.]|uniref:hypothetical protein n=1 Tax=Acidocella sp. TaxID=50710 RepID=UPI00261A2517|nr:hypothetical protein [Acidocella sp.]MDD2795155.1 hypothetical protein [Acidocella sp.]